jgi:hypothetical protein
LGKNAAEKGGQSSHSPFNKRKKTLGESPQG